MYTLGSLDGHLRALSLAATTSLTAWEGFEYSYHIPRQNQDSTYTKTAEFFDTHVYRENKRAIVYPL
jgi:hypothetical protein